MCCAWDQLALRACNRCREVWVETEEGVDGFGAHGPRQVVTLGGVGPELAYLLEAPLVFDALGDDLESETPADVDGRGKQAAAAGVEVIDEVPVDLDAVERQVVEGLEGCVAAAEVVQLDAYANPAQALQHLDGNVEVVDDRGLGDLEHERLAVESARGQHGGHLCL